MTDAAGPTADVAARLRSAGSVFAEDEARLLVEAAANAAELTLLIGRRVAGEPIEYILGWAEFCGLHIGVRPGVFVPRRRTEFLVERATALESESRHPLVVDVCCGSGAIGAALATRLPGMRLFASDIDATAVACASENLHGVGVVLHGDLFAPLPADLRGQVDLIVANAPYVPTSDISLMPREARLYETLSTLDGGSDGLNLHRRISVEAHDWLVPGGHLLLETSERQAERTARIVAEAGLDARISRSEEFDATVVTGTR